MILSKHLAAVIVMGLTFVGTACTDKALRETNTGASTALDTTKAGADKVLDATQVVAGEVAEKSKEIASDAGAAVADGWITTKVKAKLADETVLKGSDIAVDTSGHVVTLKGVVPSGDAKARAAAIARGTENVTGIVNQLVVR